MADATIKFLIETDPAGKVKSIQAIESLGNKAKKEGEKFGKGVESGLEGAVRSWGKFVAAGAAVAAVWRGISDTISKAGAAASERVKAWETKNSAFRSDQMRKMTTEGSLRLAGADEGSIATVSKGLADLQASGRGDAAAGFGGIVQALARSGLSGKELGAAMVSALGAVQQRGHLGGFAEDYAMLAVAKGVEKGADLGDLATGLMRTTFPMEESVAKALREGLAGGSVSVDAQGKLATAEVDLQAVVAKINADGGLSLRAQGKPDWARELPHGAIGGVYDVHDARDGGLDWKDPGVIGEPRPDPKATAGDYATAAFESPVAQAALAAAFVKAMDVALSSAAFKGMLGRVFGSGGAAAAAAAEAAAAGGGAAAGVAATSATASRISAVTARISAVAAEAAPMATALPVAAAMLTAPQAADWTIFGPGSFAPKGVPETRSLEEQMDGSAYEKPKPREDSAMLRWLKEIAGNTARQVAAPLMVAQ